VVIGTTTVSTHESKNRSDLEKEEIEISQGVDASWDVVDESVFTKLKRKSREERKKEKKEKRRKERERKKEERAKRREAKKMGSISSSANSANDSSPNGCELKKPVESDPKVF
ncbi:hypothetical protein ADUPG1_004322, partial [Aduncisulcus paluster]